MGTYGVQQHVKNCYEKKTSGAVWGSSDFTKPKQTPPFINRIIQVCPTAIYLIWSTEHMCWQWRWGLNLSWDSTIFWQRHLRLLETPKKNCSVYWSTEVLRWKWLGYNFCLELPDSFRVLTPSLFFKYSSSYLQYLFRKVENLIQGQTPKKGIL